MNLIYGALLLHSAGKGINEANLKKVADATGASADAALVKALVSALEGKNIDELKSKAAAMPVAVAAPSSAPAAEAKKEEIKEEDKEKKAEEAAEGLSALFG
ncbi:MAG: 50S ribosomal protein P1 [Candidatus Aenigmarchaeota archaeon]|nr:50S ribosomal protein P1 [Candidatus Aenigmarchaeota archaeon]